MKTEKRKWILGYIVEHICFILYWRNQCVLPAMESMQWILRYRVLDRNTSEGIEVDGTPEIMNLKLHDRDNNGI